MRPDGIIKEKLGKESMQATKTFKQDSTYDEQEISILTPELLHKYFNKHPLKQCWICEKSINVNLSVVELAN